MEPSSPTLGARGVLAIGPPGSLSSSATWLKVLRRGLERKGACLTPCGCPAPLEALAGHGVDPHRGSWRGEFLSCFQCGPSSRLLCSLPSLSLCPFLQEPLGVRLGPRGHPTLSGTGPGTGRPFALGGGPSRGRAGAGPLASVPGGGAASPTVRVPPRRDWRRRCAAAAEPWTGVDPSAAPSAWSRSGSR